MIAITKPLTRSSREPFMHYRRNIVVTLEPGDVIAMRLKGTRTTYRIMIPDLFMDLIRRHARVQALKKQQARKKK